MSVRCRVVYLISIVLLSASICRADDATLIQRVYQVTDLIVTPDKPEAGPTGWAESREARKPINPEDQLIQLITSTIAPPSWSDRGGPGTIEYFPLTGSLVVNQTADIQEQIGHMLAAVRRFHDLEVAVEVKFASISDQVFQSLKRGGIVVDAKAKKPSESEPLGVTFLNDKEVFLLMELLQSDTRTNVMQAPRFTTRNGQTAHFQTNDSQTFVTGLDIVQRDGHIECRPKNEEIPLGVQVGMRPIVSADRRFIQLHFAAQLSNLVSNEVPRVPIMMPGEPDKDGKPRTVTQYIEQPRVDKRSVDQTLIIPDQNTAVLSGWQASCEARTSCEVPILSEIPYLGELFRSSESHCQTEHLLILVTPRIVVPQEKEEKFLPCPQTKSEAKLSVNCAAATAVRPCAAHDYRTPILPPIREGKAPPCSEPPDEARILRAMPPIENPFPGIVHVSRDNIQIVTERIVDKVDPPGLFPHVGLAQLHHGHWKCTVYYNETIEGIHPALVFRSTKPKMQIIYLDSDHLHLYLMNPQAQP